MPTPISSRRYDAALAAARAGRRLDLAGIRPITFDWDPLQHPRDLNGRFRDIEVVGDRLESVFQRGTNGTPKDSQDLHTIKDDKGRWRYTDERRELHKAIVAAYLEGKSPRGRYDRECLMSAGGAGSGKSTVIEKGHLTPDHVVIDPDDIKNQLPEYRQLVAEGSPAATGVAHEESQDIARMLTAEAVKRNLPIFVDATGTSRYYFDRLDALADAGYAIKVVAVDCKTDTAVKRVEERKKQTGRGVNEGIVRFMHRALPGYWTSEFLPRLEDGTIYDLELWDNEGATPIRIGHTSPDGDFDVDDLDLFTRFLDKAKESKPAPPKPKAGPKPQPKKGAVGSSPAPSKGKQQSLPFPTGGYRVTKIPQGQKRVKVKK